MDVNGWNAQRRARKEDELLSQRRPDSRYPAETITPMHEHFIGGFHRPPPIPPNRPHYPPPPPSPLPPPPPPKDQLYPQPPPHPGYLQIQTQPPFHGPPPPDGLPVQQPPYQYSPSHHYPPPQSSITPTQLTHLSAVERSNILRVARMDPHLQFMVGPLLRYDTVDEFGVWHGAAMIVTADSGSIYEPHPLLTYEWDPDRPSTHHTGHPRRSFDLGPHPADPHSIILPTSPNAPSPNGYGNGLSISQGGNVRKEIVPGQEIYVYAGPGGTFTFWRFLISIPLGPQQMNITYSINSGQQLDFYVPGRSQNMRWAAHSCNGFSAGVTQSEFCGPGFKSGYDPVWQDLLAQHAMQPFHVLVGGGDQLYCDSLMREAELQEWITLKPEEKKRYPLTDEIAATIDRFYFNHYCESFRNGAFARANCTIPMMNMCDDHDIIDGFGSYPDDLQRSPVFQRIGVKGYFYFLLFQCFINPEVDRYSDKPGEHSNKSVIIGEQGPYVETRSHSFLAYLGPNCHILMLDCRGERSKEQVCSPKQYQKVFERISMLPPGVDHLIVQLGIPIAYPRMVFLETALDSKFNPLVAMGRSGSMGLSGFVNKFNAEAELLDDLNDHWTSRIHKRERNWFIEQLQLFALRKRVRVTFVSGDVHCAAVGLLRTLKAKGHKEIPSSMDHRFMLNVVSSAIVNTPPPNPVITMVSSLATKIHKTMHYCETDETMASSSAIDITPTKVAESKFVQLPLFQNETNGQPRKQKFIMGRRNWCAVEWDERTGDVIFDIRVEKEKGLGETVGYSVRAPPPAWAKGQ